MVDIYTLKPGDLVKIVDRWCQGCEENSEGKMDHWLGKTMTVRRVVIDEPWYRSHVRMEEDRTERRTYPEDGWLWYPAAIECVVDDGDEKRAYKNPSREQIKAFLFQ